MTFRTIGRELLGYVIRISSLCKIIIVTTVARVRGIVVVTIMAGSDEKPEDFAQEIILLNEYGLSPQAALAAAADHARAYLGLPPFAVGAAADVVLFNTDPRQNLNVLRQPSAIISNGVMLS